MKIVAEEGTLFLLSKQALVTLTFITNDWKAFGPMRALLLKRPETFSSSYYCSLNHFFSKYKYPSKPGFYLSFGFDEKIEKRRKNV